MRTATRVGLILFVCAAPALPRPAAAGERFRLDVEGAGLWQTRNVFAIPGTQGTRVELADVDRGPFAAGRVTLFWRLNERWSVRALAAPLRITTSFVPAAPVRFEDATFAAGAPTDVEYEFNSYRVSFFRRFAAGGGREWRFGVTAKIRDAKIGLSAPGLAREKTDLGFVPLLYLGATLGSAAAWSVDLDADALGAPQGYAVDGSIRLQRGLGGRARLFAGYRVLDGGADVDEVYSFATLHYATAGLSLGW